MALHDPKSYLEWRDGVFDVQMNDENSKAALGMIIGFECRNRE